MTATARQFEFSEWMYRTSGDILYEVRTAYERNDQEWLKRQAWHYPREFLAAADTLGVDLPLAARTWLVEHAAQPRPTWYVERGMRRETRNLAQEAERQKLVERTREQVARTLQLKAAQTAWEALDPAMPLMYQVSTDGVVVMSRAPEAWTAGEVDGWLVYLLRRIRDNLSVEG